MDTVRWRVLLPVAVLVTVAAPVLQVLPGARWLPDFWLLLSLGAVPARASEPLRYSLQVVFLFGLLRASVSAVSPWSCWAGIATALLVRERLHRHVSEESFVLRFLVGAAAALGPAWLDRLEAARFGVGLSWIETASDLVWVGLFWAVVRRPGPRRFRNLR